MMDKEKLDDLFTLYTWYDKKKAKHKLRVRLITLEDKTIEKGFENLVQFLEWLSEYYWEIIWDKKRLSRDKVKVAKSAIKYIKHYRYTFRKYYNDSDTFIRSNLLIENFNDFIEQEKERNYSKPSYLELKEKIILLSYLGYLDEKNQTVKVEERNKALSLILECSEDAIRKLIQGINLIEHTGKVSKTTKSLTLLKFFLEDRGLDSIEKMLDEDLKEANEVHKNQVKKEKFYKKGGDS